MRTKLKLLSLLLSAGAAATACVHRKSDDAKLQSVEGRAKGELIGYGAMTDLLMLRLLDGEDPANAGFEIQNILGSSAPGIKILFGGLSEVGEQRLFQNGAPNPMGFLLWYQVTGKLATAMGEVCNGGDKLALTTFEAVTTTPPFGTPQTTINETPRQLVLREAPLASLKDLCSSDAATVKAAAPRIWRQLLTAAAPANARDEWVQFATSDAVLAMGGKERVELLAHTLLMHPHLILVF
jgi:hypothetical protein